LGCYADDVARTPHIDSIAARGVVFGNCACQYPVCNPSRSSLLSGRRPPTTGVWGNATDWNEHLPLGTSLPEHFRAAGYETVRCGKMFHGGNAGRIFDDTARWSRIISQNEGLKGHPYGKPRVRYLYEGLTDEERKQSYPKRAWYWGPTGPDELGAGDGRIAEQGVRELAREHERPLFLALGFHKPHLPLLAPDRYFEMYPPEEMVIPDNPPDDRDDMPDPAKASLANHEQFTDDKRREAIGAYYACVSYVDAGIGRVLQALEESGRAENTVVIFWSDHGYHLGEHYLWQKNTLFEESARVPMIISAPGISQSGAVCRRPVELVDLFPTLFELCGLELPDGVEGTSLVPVLQDAARPWKRAGFTYRSRTHTSVRTERWRYTEYGSPDTAELYDHDADPREFTNLVGRPECADVVAELSGLIRDGWQAARD